MKLGHWPRGFLHSIIALPYSHVILFMRVEIFIIMTNPPPLVSVPSQLNLTHSLKLIVPCHFVSGIWLYCC